VRIRSIKPEFWRSQDISSLEWEIRLLFIGLWSYVDDNGVGVDRESVIAADLFADDLSREPRDTLATVSRGLQTLSERGQIVRYTVAGKRFLEITNWKQHQKIDHPNKDRYPLSTSENAETGMDFEKPSRDSRETVAPGTGEQGNRGTGEKEVASQAPPPPKTKPRKRIPDNYMPERHRIDKIRAEFPAIDDTSLKSVHEDFCLYWTGQGRPMADWDSTWLRWMRKELPRFTVGRNSSNVTAFERKKAANGAVFQSLGEPSLSELT
jgi:hypothetical protein